MGMERRLNLSFSRSAAVFALLILLELACAMYRQRLNPIQVWNIFPLHKMFSFSSFLVSRQHSWPASASGGEKTRRDVLHLSSSSSFVCILTHTIRRTKPRAFFKNENFRKSNCEFLRVTQLSCLVPRQRVERPVLPAQSTSRFLLQPLRICWFPCYQLCFCTWVIGGRGWPCCSIEVIDDSKFSSLYCWGIESSLFHTTS